MDYYHVPWGSPADRVAAAHAKLDQRRGLCLVRPPQDQGFDRLSDLSTQELKGPGQDEVRLLRDQALREECERAIAAEGSGDNLPGDTDRTRLFRRWSAALERRGTSE